MSLAKIGKGIRYLIVLNALQMASIAAFYYVAARVLSESEIGLIATLAFIYATLTTLSSLALPTAGTKYMAESLGRGEEAEAAAAAKLVVRLVLLNASIVAIGFHIALILVIQGIYSNIIPFSLICAASFLASLKLSYVAFLQGLQLFDRYITANLSTTITSHLVGILLVLKFGLAGYALGTLTGEIAGLTLVLLFYRRQLPKTTLSHSYGKLLKFSAPIFIMQVVALFSDWADRILFLAISLNLALLGVYDLSVRTAASILVISGFVEGATLPILSKIYGRAGEKDITPLLRRAIRYLGFMYFPVAFGLAAASQTVTTMLYGQAYAEGSIPLAALSISSILVAHSTLLSAALKSIGKTQAFIRISLASLLISAILVTGSTPFLGIMGAALARVSSSLLAFTLTLRELRSWIKVEVDMDGLWKGLLCSGISSASLLLFTTLHVSSVAIDLPLGIGLGIVSYGFALLLSGTLSREDFLVFRQVIPQLTSLIDMLEKSFSKFIK